MSKLAIFSDWHITDRSDKSYARLLNHLKFILTNGYTEVVFLGDIFDLMIGNKKEYLTEYKEYFELFSKIVSQCQKTIYIEGNHDFALGALYKDILDDEQKSKFIYSKKITCIDFNRLKIGFVHGDIAPTSSLIYLLYKLIIRSHFFDKLFISIMSYSLIKKIGTYLSTKSKSIRKYSKVEPAIIRNALQLYSKSIGIDFLVIGHTHVFDEARFYSGVKYLNTGDGSNYHVSIDCNCVVKKVVLE